MVRDERKEREFQMRRAEILGQAEKIFAARGFYNVTMAEIADVSGFSIGSLYQYFAGKENLYATMLCEKLDLMYAEIREQIDEAEDISGKIAIMVNAHFTFVEQNKDFCRLFLRGESAPLSDVMDKLHQKLLTGYTDHISFIENILKKGIKAGYLRQLPSRDMARALFGLIRSTAIDWMITPEAKKLSLQKDFILQVFLDGVKKHEK